MKNYFLFSIFYYLFTLIESKENEDENQIEIIEKDEEKNIVVKTNPFYLVSKDTISGVYNYDIKVPFDKDLSENFTISYGKSDKSEELPSEYNEHHSEWVKSQNNFIVSISIPISNDDKYTFVKIEDKAGNIKDKLINIKVNGNYTWKILLVSICTFLVVIISISSTCIFGQNFITKCCDYKKY